MTDKWPEILNLITGAQASANDLIALIRFLRDETTEITAPMFYYFRVHGNSNPEAASCFSSAYFRIKELSADEQSAIVDKILELVHQRIPVIQSQPTALNSNQLRTLQALTLKLSNLRSVPQIARTYCSRLINIGATPSDVIAMLTFIQAMTEGYLIEQYFLNAHPEPEVHVPTDPHQLMDNRDLYFDTRDHSRVNSAPSKAKEFLSIATMISQQKGYDISEILEALLEWANAPYAVMITLETYH